MPRLMKGPGSESIGSSGDSAARLKVLVAGNLPDNAKPLLGALATDEGLETEHIPFDRISAEFPTDLKALSRFDVIVLTGVKADQILLYPDRHKVPMGPNRLTLIRQVVRQGTGLLMCGGYSNYGGLYGQGRWTDTPVGELLPVHIKDGDDRREVPEACGIVSIVPLHPLTKPLFESGDITKIRLLGYNRVTAKSSSDVVLLSTLGDPLLVIGFSQKGRTAALAADCGPHWAGDWPEHPGYAPFFTNLVRWLAAGRK